MLVRMWSNGNPHTLLMGMYIDANSVENIMEVPQWFKNKATYNLTFPSPDIYLKKMKIPIQRVIYTYVALFTITIYENMVYMYPQ